MKTLARLAVVAVVALAASSCTSSVSEFSLIATGNPQYEAMASAPVKSGLSGTSSRWWLLFIPLGSAPTIQDAIDEMIDDGQGDFAERVRIYDTGWSLLVISYGNYTAEGDVGNSRATRGAGSRTRR